MKKTTNPIWGGRFNKRNSDLLSEINNSIGFDKHLAFQDLLVNKIYSQALNNAKIISKEENKKIQNALLKIETELKTNKINFKEEYEDIHMNIEMLVKKKIGSISGKIHTGRSRNDQVATDFKIWLIEKTNEIIKMINQLQKVIIKKAESNLNTIMPGFTHLQNAQPISLAHYLMCSFEMFHRDKLRMKFLENNLKECPLGSGALAGSNYENIDRQFIAAKLGMGKPTENSLDSVSDRDFIIEFLSYASLIAVHVSRISEDFIIWSSTQFQFIKFPDTLCTGSSIMPQKKNPDAAELIRSKSGRVFGSLVNALTILKGLPLGYSKDLQEDKEPVFDTYKTIKLVLQVMQEIIKSMYIQKDNMLSSANKGFSTSTDLADWLVKNLKISFREAHHITGEIVLVAETQNKYLHELPLKKLQEIHPNINNKIFKVLSPVDSVNQKNSYGGTNINQIKSAIKRAKKRIVKG